MRKIIYLIILISFSFVTIENCIGQRIQGAVIAGLNLSQVDGDEIYGYRKAGLNLGVSAIVPLNKNFNFSIETIYSQKGAYQSAQYETTDSVGNIYTGEYRLQLDYVEVPFLIHFNDRDVFNAGGGLSYGRLVNVKEYEHGQLVETTTLNDGPYSRSDFCILADIKFRIYEKLKFNIRYTYSLSKIRTREFTNFLGETWERDQFNNVITFRLVYVFNEDPPIANPKNKDGGF